MDDDEADQIILTDALVQASLHIGRGGGRDWHLTTTASVLHYSQAAVDMAVMTLVRWIRLLLEARLTIARVHQPVPR